jgi:hypothetical protein
MTTSSYLWISDVPVFPETYTKIGNWTDKRDLQALFHTAFYVPGSTTEYLEKKNKFTDTYSKLSAADINR